LLGSQFQFFDDFFWLPLLLAAFPALETFLPNFRPISSEDKLPALVNFQFRFILFNLFFAILD